MTVPRIAIVLPAKLSSTSLFGTSELLSSSVGVLRNEDDAVLRCISRGGRLLFPDGWSSSSSSSWVVSSLLSRACWDSGSPGAGQRFNGPLSPSSDPSPSEAGLSATRGRSTLGPVAASAVSTLRRGTCSVLPCRKCSAGFD